MDNGPHVGNQEAADQICKAVLSITLQFISVHFYPSDILLIRLSKDQSPQEQCGAKGLAQGPNGCGYIGA